MGLLGFALLLLLDLLILLSLPCNKFLKELIFGALLYVLVLWKVLKLNIELLGRIVLVLVSTTLIDLQVSNWQPR